MQPQDLASLQSRAEHLERRMRSTQVTGALTIVLLTLYACAARVDGETSPTPPQVLRVQELEIVDTAGVVRARLGGNLPDAVIQGRTVSRGDNAAGILLYDNTGQERGGYLTFDRAGNIVLTLDSRTRQVALFVADTSGASALRLSHGKDEVNLRAGAGAARFTAVRDGQVVFQEPEIANPEATATCSDLRELRARIEADRLMAICRGRMPDAACQICLGQP